MSEETIYEIRDGVRRAKAAWLCGRETIAAQIGDAGPIIPILLENLRSPHKDTIEATGVRGLELGEGLQSGATR